MLNLRSCERRSYTDTHKKTPSRQTELKGKEDRNGEWCAHTSPRTTPPAPGRAGDSKAGGALPTPQKLSSFALHSGASGLRFFFDAFLDMWASAKLRGRGRATLSASQRVAIAHGFVPEDRRLGRAAAGTR